MQNNQQNTLSFCWLFYVEHVGNFSRKQFTPVVINTGTAIIYLVNSAVIGY